eukprot:27199_1
MATNEFGLSAQTLSKLQKLTHKYNTATKLQKLAQKDKQKVDPFDHVDSISSRPFVNNSTICDVILIYGYLRKKEHKYTLSHPISQSVADIIVSYYPKIWGFGLFDDQYFTLSKYGKCIAGNHKTCAAKLIYAETMDPKGYHKGIHSWTVKAKKKLDCYHGIGIRSEYDSTLTVIQSDNHFLNTGYSYWIDCRNYKQIDESGHERDKLYRNETMTVQLDCNLWTVSFFVNNAQVQKYDIVKDQSYWFAVQICGSSKLQAIETPVCIDIDDFVTML